MKTEGGHPYRVLTMMLGTLYTLNVKEIKIGLLVLPPSNPVDLSIISSSAIFT